MTQSRSNSGESAEVIKLFAEALHKWCAEDAKPQAPHGMPSTSDVEYFAEATRQWADSAVIERGEVDA